MTVVSDLGMRPCDSREPADNTLAGSFTSAIKAL